MSDLTSRDREPALGAFRLGVDVGGTFTDLVLIAPDGSSLTRKVLSSTNDYATGILDGMTELLSEAGVEGGRVGELLHATTIATNAILERRGAKTGLITTEGFRDVLEIGRLRLARLYDLEYTRPAPLVPRRWRRTVIERMTYQGQILEPLDYPSAEREVERLIDEGVESIAVCLLHAYANDSHEQAIGKLIRERAPSIALTLSSELLPEVREFERSSTAVTNAYVMPAMRQYFRRLEKGVAEMGISGSVLVMQSSGGVMTVSEACHRPAHVVESGPAAGVVAAAALASRIGERNAISFDMGGTTAKAALIEDFGITRGSELEVGGELSQVSRLNRGSGYLLRVPAVDLAEVGAGGGSIVSVDDAHQVHVGPRSAGAIPGPACYGKGGTEATLTDASVVLGYLPEDQLASGLQIDAARAREAVSSAVAGPLGLNLLDAARGVFRLGCARMARAVRAVTVERGRDPRSFALVAFGGSGPLFAVDMARTLGIATVIVPPAPGVFSARGLLEAEVEHHAVRTFLQPLRGDTVGAIGATLAELEGEARSVVGSAGEGPVEVESYADLKYEGQSYELSVQIPEGWGERDSDVKLGSAFAREHLQSYGHAAPGDPVQLVNLRVTARLRRAGAVDARLPDDVQPKGASRRAYFGDYSGLLSTPVIGRADLESVPCSGPLLVDEYDATTCVPPGASAHLDASRNIVIGV